MTALELAMLAGSAMIWPETYDLGAVGRNREQFTRSWSEPPRYRADAPLFASDGDWWYFNLTTHALFGSEVYLAARAWRHSPLVAFVHALVASFTWEYLVEAWFKQPSAIDLFWTPMGGALLGELRFVGMRAARRRIASRAGRHVVLALLDPLGELERAVLQCDF